MRVLMIEDNQDDITGIIDHCEEKGWEHEVCPDFGNGLLKIDCFDPDVIVLDLQNNEDTTYPGTGIINKIWEKQFRPVCVFSGQIVNSAVEKGHYPSPLIRFIDKGDERPVNDFLDQIEPYIISIKDMQQRTHEAYKRSFDVLEFVIEDKITDANIIAYLCNNRIKDSFSFELEDSALPAWGQYIYPSLSKHFSTGDVVCCQDELNNKSLEEKTYYVIMSPSCDIVHHKISRILAVKCKNIKSLCTDLCLPSHDSKEARKKLSKILNTGYFNRFFILPSLGKILPDLIVDMKDICTIEFGDLDKYKKIISLSSPYCERLVWAYMQNACRPGVPTLDVEKWAERLIPDNGSNE